MYNWFDDLKDKVTDRIKKNENGFSLPEIMIAIVIFAVLVSIAVPIFISAQNNSKGSDLDTELVNASFSVETERQLNNGVYPSYTPKDIANTAGGVTLVYTYSTSQLQFCLKGTLNGTTKYLGSITDDKVSTTNCTLPNVGGVQPGDENTNPSAPASNHNPTITSLSPSTLYSRAGGETITITGTEFINGASVLVDSVQVGATVVSATKITFVNPGDDTYRAIPIQVKNPNARTSDPKNLNLVNPIVATTATTPTAITTNEATAGTDVTATATTITCPSSATPQYSYKLVRLGSTVNDAGITSVSNKSDSAPLSTWRTSNKVVIDALYGQRYGLKVQARCLLEGKTGTASAWSAEKVFTEPIPMPGKPTAAPTFSPSSVLVNSQFTISWPAQTCADGNGVYYNLYNGTDNIAETSVTSLTLTAPPTFGTQTYNYSYVCQSAFVESPVSPKSDTGSLSVYASPSAPPAVTGLGLIFGFNDMANFDWNETTCNVGTPTYSFQWVTGSSGSTPYSATTGFNTSGLIGARDYTYRVGARCESGGLISGVTYSSTASYTPAVATPSGNFGTVTASGIRLTDNNSTLNCVGGATLQYQAVRLTLNGQSAYDARLWDRTSNYRDIVGTAGQKVTGVLNARCLSADGTTAGGIRTSPTVAWTVS